MARAAGMKTRTWSNWRAPTRGPSSPVATAMPASPPCLNLTNAGSFAEFVAEVRAGHSSVLFMPHYREPMPLRVLETAWDILRPYPEYPGRERWTDRVFYRSGDGVARPLSMIWGPRMPWILRPATGLVQLLASAQIRLALRLLLARRVEALP